MQIIDLLPDHKTAVQQAAAILYECFGHLASGYSTMAIALEEVEGFFQEGRIIRIAVDQTGTVLGWTGGIRQYDGYVWELHPLVVGAAYRRQGIGRSLVADLEVQVRNRGGITLWVGTDDEENQTTLSGVSLYSNPFEHIAQIKNLRQHPYEFYQKCGFAIVGVMPDANGLGKPDIYMAKRVSQFT
ncbi:MAG: aminoglycoside N-acetyltransferase AAC(6')-Ii [Elainellaceae cyanobacterium]